MKKKAAPTGEKSSTAHARFDLCQSTGTDIHFFPVRVSSACIMYTATSLRTCIVHVHDNCNMSRCVIEYSV